MRPPMSESLRRTISWRAVRNILNSANPVVLVDRLRPDRGSACVERLCGGWGNVGLGNVGPGRGTRPGQRLANGFANTSSRITER